jgi:Tol biopolymer transport system component
MFGAACVPDAFGRATLLWVRQVPFESAITMLKLVFLGSSALLVCAGAVVAQGVQRVSVATGGAESNGNVEAAALSGDGRYVAFASTAADLVPGDTNGVMDIFVHDRQMGVTTRVSVSGSGVQGNGASAHPSISEDGRYVAFHSEASNLESGDVNTTYDVFVHDRVTGSTDLVSQTPFGFSGVGMSFSPAISGDGNWVLFFSGSNDLDPADMNPWTDAFFVNRASGVVSIASLSTTGGPGDWHVGVSPGVPGGTGISRDGRYAVFVSEASLDPVDQDGTLDTYLRDRVAGVTTLVSIDPNGVPAFYDAWQPAISGDGRFVVFYSADPRYVPNDTNGLDAIVRDMQSGSFERVTVDSFGAQVTYVGPIQAQLVGYPTISHDGRFVAFETAYQKLVPGDLGVRPDVFVHDRLNRVTQLVSRGSSGGPANEASARGSISSDGTFVAFQSVATDLVSGDTNAMPDVFVGVVPPTPAPFCFGDGSGTACPCGNAGGAFSGCANSSTAAGSRLVGTGRASVTDDTLTLMVNGLPASTQVAFLQGTGQAAGGAGIVFGDGLRCVVGTTVRLGTRASTGGTLAFGHGIAGDPHVSVAGMMPAGGGSRHYQGFYRNAASFCSSATFNLTNGISLTWSP